MAVIDDFKTQKKSFKRVVNSVSDLFDEYEDMSDAIQKQKKLNEIKKGMGSLEKNLKELEFSWQNLDPSDKAHYKQKITQKRSEYETIRKRFFKAEDILNDENNRNKLYQHTSLNVNSSYSKRQRFEEEDKQTRGRLLKGVDNLNGQEQQLINTKKKGVETQQILQAANMDLRGQRDQIIDISDKNQETYQLMVKAGQKVREMSRREFCYRIGMYSAIVILLLAIVIAIVVKIIK